jgi:NAD-dependent dihydropyrimidine dehydrogenase PreA subunit
MPFIITEACEGVCDTSCVDVCPVDCIYPPKNYNLESTEDKEKIRAANEQLYINPEECIDCGACEPECPVEAIYPEEEVPENLKQFIRKNYERFGIEVTE